MKSITKTLIAAAAAVCAMQAQALVYTIGAGPGSYVPFSMSQLDAFNSLTSERTGSLPDQWLAPLGVAGTPYMVVSAADGMVGYATISFATALDSYSFLWGSPDVFNSLVFTLADSSTVTYDGAQLGTLGGFTADGNNANTRWFTASADGSLISSVTFKSSGVAFEVANVSPVPEPETYALLLAGLAALVFVARRRNV